mgnify:CR=1 FL=1
MKWNSHSYLGFGVLATLMLTSANLAAQQSDVGTRRLEDSPRHHEWANFKTETGRTVRAFVVYPEVDAPAPAVVVIHENRGLNPHIEDIVRRLALDGFMAFAPDALQRIFERFYTDRPHQDYGQNSGLGLSISKQIIEAHGGTVWVDSQEGQGSTFSFALPVREG